MNVFVEQIKAQGKSKGGKVAESSRATPPKVDYQRPSSVQVQAMVEEENFYLLQKGDESDEEVNLVESPLDLLSEKFDAGSEMFSEATPNSETEGSQVSKPKIVKRTKRVGFKLLREIWKESF